MPLLHLVQAEDSYFTPAGLEFCGEQLGLTGAEVAAVASFYSMYRRGPTGEYLVGVCTNTLCAVMGGDAIFDSLKEHLGIENDQTTEDGSITLQHVECNAACDYAPVVMVNWEFFDNQTRESARELVEGCGAANPRRRAAASLRCARSVRPAESWRVFPINVPTRAKAAPARPPWPVCGLPRNAAWRRRQAERSDAEVGAPATRGGRRITAPPAAGAGEGQ